VEVKGDLIVHAWGTEIRLLLSRSRDGQTHRVTLVSQDGERVNAGTFIGVGDKPLKCTFDAELSREDATRLDVRTTPGGELVFFAKLPEEPRVADRHWPLAGILPWADLGLQNETMGASVPECTEGASSEDPADTQEKPKDDGSGDGTPHKENSPESDGKRSSPGGEKPRAVPEESEPDRGPYDQPPNVKPPVCDQYECQT
jgi:hypothetical protein